MIAWQDPHTKAYLPRSSMLRRHPFWSVCPQQAASKAEQGWRPPSPWSPWWSASPAATSAPPTTRTAAPIIRLAAAGRGLTSMGLITTTGKQFDPHLRRKKKFRSAWLTKDLLLRSDIYQARLPHLHGVSLPVSFAEGPVSILRLRKGRLQQSTFLWQVIFRLSVQLFLSSFLPAMEDTMITTPVGQEAKWMSEVVRLANNE